MLNSCNRSPFHAKALGKRWRCTSTIITLKVCGSSKAAQTCLSCCCCIKSPSASKGATKFHSATPATKLRQERVRQPPCMFTQQPQRQGVCTSLHLSASRMGVQLLLPVATTAFRMHFPVVAAASKRYRWQFAVPAATAGFTAMQQTWQPHSHTAEASAMGTIWDMQPSNS